jgi:hypothetical protein
VNLQRLLSLSSPRVPLGPRTLSSSAYPCCVLYVVGLSVPWIRGGNGRLAG